MKKLVKINGMDCLSCKFKIEEAFEKIEGIDILVDLDTQIATITASKNLKDEEIIKIIKKAGFNAVII